jgi:hypothetical protein
MASYPSGANIFAIQVALNQLSAATKDKSIAVTADSVLGPKTLTAVNRALSVHIGPGQAADYLRTGAVQQQTVVDTAGIIATILATEALRRGGASLVAAAASAATSALTKKTPAKAKTPTAESEAAVAPKPAEAAWLTFLKKPPVLIGGGIIVVGGIAALIASMGGGSRRRIDREEI